MIYSFYVLLVISTAISALFSIIFLSGWKGYVSVALYAFNCLLLIGYIYMSLGNPLPVDFISSHIFSMKNVKVLWVGFKEKEAIYLLLNGAEPYYVKLPWDDKTAEQLQQIQQAMSKKGENGMPAGGEMMAIDPLSLETRESKFKHVPPPKQRSELKPN